MSLQISQRTAEMLDWPEFLRFYLQFVSSPAARDLVHTIQPVQNLEEELALSRDSLACAQKGSLPSFTGLEDISTIINRTTIENSVLSGAELYSILRLAMLNNTTRNDAREWRSEFSHLYSKAARLPDLRNIEQDIQTKIEPSGEVKEDATPELTRIRKQLTHLTGKVQHALERYLRDNRFRSALQEDYITSRHGRSVLVVRSEMQNAVRGIIHGESGSTASVFVEPFAVVELNNEMAQLIDRQQREINRILKELTAAAGRESDALQFALQELVSLDLVLARGRFGSANRCIIPELSQTFRLVVVEGRHPLLQTALAQQQKEMVPFSAELNSDQKALVVTGPNTGGKTVFLKTCGLLALLAHCGLPVPAKEGTVLPQLAAIEADIGDQQSIQESLSTFSSHMTNIIRILSNVKPRSLLLLDELGTGTDPEEGAPLAVAILQELLKYEVKVLVTSHHSQMKMFAFNHPQCVTAAMEFDQNRLAPTYQILVDQIGASHGFDMAQRLGLPEPVLRLARSFAGQSQIQLQEFQTRLNERIRVLEGMQQTLELEKAEWQARANFQSGRVEQLQSRLEEKLKTLREQNTDLIRTLNARVETLMENIRDAESRQKLRQEIKTAIEPAMEQLSVLTAEAQPEQASEVTFTPGERVWVSLYKDFGEVVSVKKGTAELIIRNKRFQVPVSMLERRQSIADTLPKGVSIQMQDKEIDTELNLIGKTVEEALLLVDKYLDDAFLAQAPEVRLIHGRGTGTLTKALHDWLPDHPHVRRFFHEEIHRGGNAITVVQLKL